jgi:hypothetical protein
VAGSAVAAAATNGEGIGRNRRKDYTIIINI